MPLFMDNRPFKPNCAWVVYEGSCSMRADIAQLLSAIDRRNQLLRERSQILDQLRNITPSTGQIASGTPEYEAYRREQDLIHKSAAISNEIHGLAQQIESRAKALYSDFRSPGAVRRFSSEDVAAIDRIAKSYPKAFGLF